MPRRSRQRFPVARHEWVHRGRAVVVVEVTSKGPVVTVRPGSTPVDAAAKESAAWWLAQLLTRLTHDEAYATLWGP